MAIFTYYWMNSEEYSVLWANLWAIFMYFYTSIHALLGDFEYTKAVSYPYTVAKVGGGIGQNPGTQLATISSIAAKDVHPWESPQRKL